MVTAQILKIRFDTAIPPSGRMVDFTRSMLTKPTSKDAKETQKSISPTVSLGPDVFYSDEHYYPTNLSHDKMMEFLFNKEQFEEIISKQAKADPTQKEKVQKHNIMITLKCLFQVGYPVINDIDDSHSLLNAGSSANTLWFYPFRDYKSYLTIGGDVYTVQRVVWINDEYNYNLELNKDRTTSSTAKLPEGDVKTFVGVTDPIYVMLDLIKGEVNKENKGSIYCAYTGEILGHKLSKMFKSATANSKHKIDHSILFSMKDGKNISGVKELTETVNPEDEALKTEFAAWRTSNKENKTTYETFTRLFRRVENDPTMKYLMKKSGFTTPDKLLKLIKDDVERPNLSGFYLFLRDNDAVNFDGAKREAKDALAVANNRNVNNKTFIEIVNKLLDLSDYKAYLSLPTHGGSNYNKKRHYHKPHTPFKIEGHVTFYRRKFGDFQVKKCKKTRKNRM